MLGLMKNEKAYKKLVDEIDDAVRDGKVPSGPEEVVSDFQGRQLPYLQAVIKEVGGSYMMESTGAYSQIAGSEIAATDRRASCKTGLSPPDSYLRSPEPQV